MRFKLFGNTIDINSRKRDLNDTRYTEYDDIYGYGDENYTQGLGLANIDPEMKRSKIYDDVDFIDKFDEVIAKYLDDLSHDIVQHSNIVNSSIWVSSEDAKIQDTLTKMIDDLSLEEEAPTICRGFTKYGDFFSRLIIDPEKGIVGVKNTDHPKMWVRLEDADQLVGFHKERDLRPLQRYEVIHWMAPSRFVVDDILNNRNQLFEEYIIDHEPGYGFSSIFKVIASAKRLKYAEDALLLGRLATAKLYRMHFVETGTSTVDERIKIMKRYIKNFNKNKGVNYSDQDMFSDQNQFSYEEDRFFPVIDGKGSSRMEQIGGDLDIRDIADIDHLKKKRNFVLGLPEEIEMMTNRLQEDYKYARFVSNMQRQFLKGMYQMSDIHLDILGMWSPEFDEGEKPYKVHLVDVDAFVQGERTQIFTESVDFIERIMNLTMIEGVAINKTYLFDFLIRNYLKFPGIEMNELFNAEPNPVAGDPNVSEEATMERVIKAIQNDSFSQEKLGKISKIISEKTKRNDPGMVRSSVPSKGDPLREKQKEDTDE